MSARIFIHPRNSMSLAELVSRYVAHGYVVRTTLRGHLEVRHAQSIANMKDYLRSPQCPQH